MAAGNFIKDNLALVAGIAVPVLLVVGFLLTSTLGKLLTAPPAHTAYFIYKDNGYNRNLPASREIKVAEDGSIVATLTPVKQKKDGGHFNAQTDIIVAYNAKNNTLTPINFEVPQGKTKGEFTPAILKDVKLVTEATAADGYSVTYGNRGGHSFVGDIFMARGADGYRIRKNGAVYRLPDPVINGTIYNNRYNLRFLGWGSDTAQ